MIYKNRFKDNSKLWLVGLAVSLITLVFMPSSILAQEKKPEASGEVKTSETEETMSLQERLDQQISLDYKNADLSNVLRSLSYAYDLNIVTISDIKGKVTITLSNVEVGKALEAILTVNGLMYFIKDEMVYISKGDPEKVNLLTEVIRPNYIEAAKAQNLLRKLISAKGDIEIDESSNTLIVIDFPSNIQKIMQLIDEIDVAPRQVLIEAKIIDITSKDLAALGVKWSVNYAPGHGIFNRNTQTAEELKATIDIASVSSSLSGGQLTLDTLTLKGIAVTATIDALVKDGKANLLASPSIAILNNKEARIVIGERYPYKERTQTATGTTETTKFVDIGVTLKVTPQINADGYITMHIHPEVSSLHTAMDAGPRITTREADTTVRIKEGDTLVIAGLIKHVESSSREKIPLLGDIPILGFFFSRSARDVERKELAIFITPKLLRSPEEIAALSKDKIEKEEVYIDIDTAGKLALINHIFNEAKNLETGRGIESARKSKQHRKLQALGLYKHIYVKFPESERAPEAMYRAGLIYYKYLKDEKKAEDIFAHLISDYPDSEYTRRAKKIYRKLTSSKKEIEKPKGIELNILPGK